MLTGATVRPARPPANWVRSVKLGFLSAVHDQSVWVASTLAAT
jgi:hypothetical protein